MNLADCTTLRLGGPASRAVEVTTALELVNAVTAAEDAGESVLLIGGGSNLVVCDEGFDGTAILIRTSGVEFEADECSGATVTVAAGEDWDSFVARAIDYDWVGIEALSGIPGCVGATPIQNVGAYGQEVSQTIASVHVWDRAERNYTTFATADCGFGYRTSRFKIEQDRFVVLSVTFQLALDNLSAPIAYTELARSLGVAVGERGPVAEVRDAVLALRRTKGMVLDAVDHDTWSAGSFFTNPLLDTVQAEALPDAAPRFAQPDGRVKTSAAWLIDNAGFGKGYGSGPVTVSTKHALALTNRGAARTSDLIALAREIRQGVQETFGITLDNEPNLVGCTL